MKSSTNKIAFDKLRAQMAKVVVGQEDLVFGLLVIGFLEYRDTSFRREEDVVRVLTVPVLALIPVMASDRERQAQRRRAWVVDFAGIAVLAGSAAVLAFWRMQW